jgi:hypothetical protein
VVSFVSALNPAAPLLVGSFKAERSYGAEAANIDAFLDE